MSAGCRHKTWRLITPCIRNAYGVDTKINILNYPALRMHQSVTRQLGTKCFLLSWRKKIKKIRVRVWFKGVK
jgi:hypothetical protein